MKRRDFFFISFYRIVFKQCKKTYEIYARYISDESIIGFIEIHMTTLDKLSLNLTLFG